MDKPKRAQKEDKDIFENNRARIKEAIWTETPPVRFLGAVRNLLQVYVRRQFFNDTFVRYKKTRGLKIGGHGCITRNIVFIDLNKSYYEHMLISIRRTVGGTNDQLRYKGKGHDYSTYSLCAILSELSSIEKDISVENGFDISSIRKRFIGRKIGPNVRAVKVTKNIKRRRLISGSVSQIKSALVSYIKRLTEIVNKHLAHLGTKESQQFSKAGDVTTFEVRDRDIEKVLRRIVDVYDALEHLFAPNQEYGLMHEEANTYNDYERLMGLEPNPLRGQRLFVKTKLKVFSWRHGDLTSALVRRASFVRLGGIIDEAKERAGGAKFL